MYVSFFLFFFHQTNRLRLTEGLYRQFLDDQSEEESNEGGYSDSDPENSTHLRRSFRNAGKPAASAAASAGAPTGRRSSRFQLPPEDDEDDPELVRVLAESRAEAEGKKARYTDPDEEEDVEGGTNGDGPNGDGGRAMEGVVELFED